HYHSEVQNYQENEEKILYNAGRILTGVGFISRVITDSKTVLAVRAANSYSAYSEAASSGIIDDLGVLMLPGVFSLFYSDKLSRVIKRTIFWVMLFYLILIMILTGSRKIQVFSILALVLVYTQSLGITFSKKRVLVFLIVTVFLLNVLVVIR
ncbi:TPA: O-antigen polysaccharide polymerase Wzy, partial [Streptococcus pneumoniae]|nr:O-antigen polysaccharide polymerase Wzy [Streptococcus pneumoniae]